MSRSTVIPALLSACLLFAAGCGGSNEARVNPPAAQEIPAPSIGP